MNAIELTADHLGHWVTVIDFAGRAITGRLSQIELSRDPRTRVVLGIDTQDPINAEDGGGWYWSTFSNRWYVNQDANVEVGELAPADKDEATA